MAKIQNTEAPREKTLLEQFSEAVVIDKHNLDEMWVQQPDIFWRVGDQVARANNARDKYKLVRDQIVVEVGAQLREDAEAAVEAAGKGRVSETALSRDIELDDRVKEARQEYQRLCFLADRWAALLAAYTQRSYALKDITSLHISNYYQSSSGMTQREGAADHIRAKAGEQRRKG